LILRKLGAYPRQNGLAIALREIGRIERTLFTLQWLQDPLLRRRVTAGLNKGEARNFLARAVFFHRLGEIRDSSYESQRYRPAASTSSLRPSRSGTRSTLSAPLRLYADSATSTRLFSRTSRRWAGITSTSPAITSGMPISAS